MSDLKQYIEQIETLEEEKAAIQEQVTDLFKAAKADGFDTKIMKAILKLRKLDPAALRELDHLVDMYRAQLGL